MGSGAWGDSNPGFGRDSSHQLPWASVSPWVPRGLSVLRFNPRFFAHRIQSPPPGPALLPASCQQLQVLMDLLGLPPCIRKMGKPRHREAGTCLKSLGDQSGSWSKAQGSSLPQCQEVGGEGVRLGLKCGIGSARPVGSTGMKCSPRRARSASQGHFEWQGEAHSEGGPRAP